jgi:drug/metabolite transporter (DMT)-like permease
MTADKHPSTSQGNTLKGIIILVAAVFCMSCMDASAKWLNRDITTLQIAGMRYFVSLLVVLVFVNPWRMPGVFRAHKLGLQCGRGICLIGSTLGMFFAVKSLPLTQVTAISFAAPLITALLAGPVLAEKIGPRRLAAVLVGFAGVLIVTRPFGGAMPPAALFAVLAACANAAYYLSTRMLAAHDKPETTMFYTSLVGTVLVSPFLLFSWKAPSTALVWIILILLGVFGAIGHWLLILAHRHAPASILAPFFYLQILGSVFFGYFVFGNIPDRWTVIGSSTVIGSGLYLLYRERVRHKFPSADLAA